MNAEVETGDKIDRKFMSSQCILKFVQQARTSPAFKN